MSLTPTDLTALLATLQQQESALRQIQKTLDELTRTLGPARVPAAPPSGEVVSVVGGDPMSAGYTLSQRALAEALHLPPSYVSTLVRAFHLDDDPRCAVVVRPGAKRLVNYHPRAIERFRELLDQPPAGLDERARRTVEQVRGRLAEAA